MGHHGARGPAGDRDDSRAPSGARSRRCQIPTSSAPVPPGSPQSAARQSATGSPPASPAETGEFAIIDRITGGLRMADGVQVGPGDDAAVVTAPDGRIVISVDMLVEGVHFRSDWATPEQIGRRAALASMADIAAMGAVPTALVVAVAAPVSLAPERLVELGRGLSAAAEESGASLVGGDLARSDALTVSVTVIGDLGGSAPVLRSGARPGDQVAVCGRLGWAGAGLTVLSRGFRSPAALVNAYRVPEPPLAAGPQAAAAGATSMIDVSDGLLADLGHIARASQVAINIRSRALEVAPRLAEVGSALGKDPLDWVLTGGDDHALVATFPPGAALPADWTVIGSAGAPGDLGVVVTVDGEVRDGPGGWDHFGAAGGR